MIRRVVLFRNKVRIIASSFFIVLLLVGGTFYVVKNGFKADTIIIPPNPATLSYVDAGGGSTTIESNNLEFTRMDVEQTIEDEMTVVIRIANACKTYAGAGKVFVVNDPNFSDNAKFDILKAGNQPICDTSVLSGSQKTEATGNYPLLPEGFNYSPADGLMYEEEGTIINPNLEGNVVAISHGNPNGDNELFCTLAACTKGNNW